MKLTTTSRGNSKRRRMLGVIVALLLVAALVGTYVWYSEHRFGTAYRAFAVAERGYDDAAYKPSVQSNPVRQEVGFLLSQVLQVSMSPQERLEKAKQGIAHLNDIEGQIDAIQTEGEKVAPLLDALDASAHAIGTVRTHAQMQEIVSLARKNSQIIADIRGLSYRADYYTDEVFERIIDEQGQLTPAHVTYLNDLIPQLEEQFNHRQKLYDELKKNSDRIVEIAGALGYAPQP